MREGEATSESEHDSNASTREPVPASRADSDRGQPEGVGGVEGQVEPQYRWPTFEDVRDILNELAIGLYPAGERATAFLISTPDNLHSALGLPHQPYYGSFYNRLAAMVRSIACNHGLADGNKRLAVTVLHSTLLVNGYLYAWSNDDAVALILRCASGETSYEWLADFIEVWSTRTALPEGIVAMSGEQLSVAMAAQDAALAQVMDQQPDSWLVREVRAHHARGEMSQELIAQLLERRRSTPDG